jgi:hypothetical protein
MRREMDYEKLIETVKGKDPFGLNWNYIMRHPEILLQFIGLFWLVMQKSLTAQALYVISDAGSLFCVTYVYRLIDSN